MPLLKISDIPPAVQGKEIFKLQPFLTGLSSSLSSVAGASKSLCSPAEGPGVLLPPCAPLIHVQICSWRPWTLQRSSYWQLCLGLAKDVPLSSLTVLQMVSQDCIEEHKSWVKAFFKKINHCDKCLACALLKVLFYFQWSFCRRLPYRMRLPCVLPSASPQGCPSFLLSASASLMLLTRTACTALLFDSFAEGAPLMYGKQPRNSDIEKNTHKINPLDPTN